MTSLKDIKFSRTVTLTKLIVTLTHKFLKVASNVYLNTLKEESVMICLRGYTEESTLKNFK